MKKEQEQKENFWQRHKMLLIGVVGMLLLLSSMSAQNVVVAFQAEGGEQYAVKLDYSVFGMCIRCYPGSQNSNDITEKAIFFGAGQKKTVVRAVEGLMEIAGTKEGTVQLQANGILPNNEKVTDDLVSLLNGLGYTAKEVE